MILRRALHVAVHRAEHVLPIRRAAGRTRSRSGACCPRMTSLIHSAPRLLIQTRLWPIIRLKNVSPWRSEDSESPKRRKFGPHDFSVDVDHEVALARLVDRAGSRSRSNSPRPYSRARSDSTVASFERLAGAGSHLLLEHLRIRVARAFDASRSRASRAAYRREHGARRVELARTRRAAARQRRQLRSHAPRAACLAELDELRRRGESR